MSRHTPGPWSVNPQPDPTAPRYATIYVKPGDHTTVDHVAQVGEHLTKHSGDWRANACLIAAAPDLLAVLKLIEEEMPPEDVERDDRDFYVAISNQMIDAIRAVIARAEDW